MQPRRKHISSLMLASGMLAMAVASNLGALHGSHACSHCPNEPHGPELVADCHEGCTDPDHHHDRRPHDCEQCVVCQTLRTLITLAAASTDHSAPIPAGLHHNLPGARPVHLFRPSAHPVRGPPLA